MATFKVMAHRGASADAPDNTAQAFRLALAQKADMIETDIQITQDGVLVVSHDLEIENRLVCTLRLEELQALKPDVLTVGATLAEFGAKIAFCWEVKAPGIETALVNLVRDLIPAALWEMTEFSSFTIGSAVKLKQLAPNNKVGWLTRDWNAKVIAQTRAAGLSQICPRTDEVMKNPDLVAAAHEAGLLVRLWSVKLPELVPPMAALGVYGGTVNFPAAARAALENAYPAAQ